MPDNTDAKVRRDPATTEASLPFFARFLESQHYEESVPQPNSERWATLKYPSDRDEDIDGFLNS